MNVQEEFLKEYHQGSFLKKALLILTGFVFAIVYMFLLLCSKVFHVSYNTVNVVAYYFLMPLSWAFLLDRLLELPYVISTFYVGVWFGIALMTIGRFQTWCDTVFWKSVGFLLWFRKIGWNYHLASVIICVIVPIIVYSLLIYFQ